MTSSEPWPYSIGELHCKISASSTVIALLIKSIWLRAWGTYVKHLKKLPLCVFGGYLVSMYSLLRKEEESYTYYSRTGGKFMLTYKREIYASLKEKM
jgi:hypothetical protein